jgi:hypothetical protein
MKTNTIEITITDHDPGTMTADDRRAEIVRILAAGYRRLSVDRPGNCLEHLPPESPDGDGENCARKDVA